MLDFAIEYSFIDVYLSGECVGAAGVPVYDDASWSVSVYPRG